MASLHSCCLLWAPQSFHFPLFMTMLHLAVIFLFSALSRALVQCSSHRARVVLSWTDYLRRVAPTGGSSVRRRAARKQKPLWPHTACLLSSPPLSHGRGSAKQAASLSVLVHMGLSGLYHVAMPGGAKRFPRTSLEWARLKVDGNLWPWVCEVRKERRLLEQGAGGKGLSRPSQSERTPALDRIDSLARGYPELLGGREGKQGLRSFSIMFANWLPWLNSLSPQHWQQHLTWACPTGASSISLCRCEY